jgi:HD-like signal output (HDOD) protein
MLTRSWMLPVQVCKAILYHHDNTVFSSSSETIEPEICSLIGIVHMAEYIVDEHLNAKSEWHQFEREVLRHFEMSGQEFFELKQDILAFLSGE